MGPSLCVRFSCVCVVAWLVLACAMTVPANGQTIGQPTYALDVSGSHGAELGRPVPSRRYLRQHRLDASQRSDRYAPSYPRGRIYVPAQRDMYHHNHYYPHASVEPPYGYRGWRSPPGANYTPPWKLRGRMLDDNYYFWRYWYLTKRTKERSKRLGKKHELMMARGLTAFASGDYEQARSAFVLAASMNTFDPACRIHAAHSCFALARYDRAVHWLGEAFHREPRIRELPYDIRSDYGSAKDFQTHLATLRTCVAKFPKEAGPLIVLGYVSYYVGDRPGAYQALSKASKRLAKAAPEAKLVKTLMETCRPRQFMAAKTRN